MGSVPPPRAETRWLIAGSGHRGPERWWDAPCTCPTAGPTGLPDGPRVRGRGTAHVPRGGAAGNGDRELQVALKP